MQLPAHPGPWERCPAPTCSPLWDQPAAAARARARGTPVRLAQVWMSRPGRHPQRPDGQWPSAGQGLRLPSPSLRNSADGPSLRSFSQHARSVPSRKWPCGRLYSLIHYTRHASGLGLLGGVCKAQEKRTQPQLPGLKPDLLCRRRGKGPVSGSLGDMKPRLGTQEPQDVVLESHHLTADRERTSPPTGASASSSVSEGHGARSRAR